ncbi:protein kinase domain-containing protein [Pantoea ananatis]|uniref:protein kinase domain-containing protein n=1 Tax=Pantoea ananas TaxID=553 RepID=UPI003FA40A22
MTSMQVSVESPAQRLKGLVLDEKWVVGERLLVGVQAGGKGTGGHFSVSYKVSSINGKTNAFLKAFDFHKTLIDSLKGQNFMEVMASVMGDYQFEDKLNDICLTRRFKKVVKVLDKGQVVVDGNYLNIVPYLIMEMADCGDIRAYVDVSGELSQAAKLEYLKDVTTGLNQLHSARISHQDLKPSNVMVFTEHGAKIGDLGRASLQGHNHWYDDADIAGDMSYAPIEQLYGFKSNEWIDRRERCDLYQLGSVICFLMLGTTLNAMLKQHIPQSAAPQYWGGEGNSFIEALPHIEHAFNVSIDQFKSIEPEWLGQKLRDIVIRCSHPRVDRRGAVQTIGMKKPILGLDRLISEFDYLIKQLRIKGH